MGRRAQDPPFTCGVEAHGDHVGHGDHPVGLADLVVGGVEPDVGEFLQTGRLRKVPTSASSSSSSLPTNAVTSILGLAIVSPHVTGFPLVHEDGGGPYLVGDFRREKCTRISNHFRDPNHSPWGIHRDLVLIRDGVPPLQVGRDRKGS